MKVFLNAVDYSLEAENYLDQTISVTILSTDKLYVGYEKPINAIYLEMSTPNATALDLSLKYWDGSAFTDVTNLKDKTFGLIKSGHLYWDRNLTDEAATTVNSLTLFWYEISLATDSDAIVIDGLNLVLSSDKDLQNYEEHLLDGRHYPKNKTSFIGYHQGARNEIIQRLRNQGKGIYNLVEYKDLNVFDLLDWTQLSVASTYLVLSKIYFNKSDSPDDKYYQKFVDYRAMYDEAFNLYYLSIDKNDDGLQDVVESAGIQYRLIERI